MQKNTADTLLTSTAFLRKILSCFIVSVSLPDFYFPIRFLHAPAISLLCSFLPSFLRNFDKGGRVPQAPPPSVGFTSFYRTITKLSIWHFERSFNVPRPSHTILAQNHSMLLYSFPQIFLFLNCI